MTGASKTCAPWRTDITATKKRSVRNTWATRNDCAQDIALHDPGPRDGDGSCSVSVALLGHPDLLLQARPHSVPRAASDPAGRLDLSLVCLGLHLHRQRHTSADRPAEGISGERPLSLREKSDVCGHHAHPDRGSLAVRVGSPVPLCRTPACVRPSVHRVLRGANLAAIVRGIIRVVLQVCIPVDSSPAVSRLPCISFLLLSFFTSVHAQEAAIPPGDNLAVEGIPRVPATL